MLCYWWLECLSAQTTRKCTPFPCCRNCVWKTASSHSLPRVYQYPVRCEMSGNEYILNSLFLSFFQEFLEASLAFIAFFMQQTAAFSRNYVKLLWCTAWSFSVFVCDLRWHMSTGFWESDLAAGMSTSARRYTASHNFRKWKWWKRGKLSDFVWQRLGKEPNVRACATFRLASIRCIF